MNRKLFVAGGVVGFASMTARLPAAPLAALHALDLPYDLETPTGTLGGSLRLPANASRPAVVLIIAGSGPTNRDGDSGPVGPRTYLRLADALEARGIASVRFDKRGVGASAPALANESDIRFETYAGDAATWIAKLRADRRFGRVALAGHSEGSLIGMLAAQRAHLDGYISLCGPSTTLAATLRRQLGPKLASAPELAAASERIIASLEAGTTVADVPGPLLPLYRPSVQPYLISVFRYDPSAEIENVDAPAAIVGGTADIQVPADEANSLAARLPHATLAIVDGMSHPLKSAAGMTPEQQIATVYRNPDLPVMPQVPDTIAALLA